MYIYIHIYIYIKFCPFGRKLIIYIYTWTKGSGDLAPGMMPVTPSMQSRTRWKWKKRRHYAKVFETRLVLKHVMLVFICISIYIYRYIHILLAFKTVITYKFCNAMFWVVRWSYAKEISSFGSASCECPKRRNVPAIRPCMDSSVFRNFHSPDSKWAGFWEDSQYRVRWACRTWRHIWNWTNIYSFILLLCVQWG